MPPTCPYTCYREHKPSSGSPQKNIQHIKLVFFDMDGVLTDTLSSWKHIHDYFHTSNERSVDAYLKGIIDDLEFIRRDVSLWKEKGRLTTTQTLQHILDDIQLIPGAKECMTYLRNHHIKTAIVSAGLDLLANKVAQKLGIDYVFANGVLQDAEGRLTGEGILRVQLVHKEKNVELLSEHLHIPLTQCAAVGNSCFDIPMFEVCTLGIAFNPSDACVRKAADIIVEGKNLALLIPTLEQWIQ